MHTFNEIFQIIYNKIIFFLKKRVIFIFRINRSDEQILEQIFCGVTAWRHFANINEFKTNLYNLHYNLENFKSTQKKILIIFVIQID